MPYLGFIFNHPNALILRRTIYARNLTADLMERKSSSFYLSDRIRIHEDVYIIFNLILIIQTESEMCASRILGDKHVCCYYM